MMSMLFHPRSGREGRNSEMHTLRYNLHAGLLAILALAWPMMVSAAMIEAAAGTHLCANLAKFFHNGLPDAALRETVEWKPVDVKGQGPSRSRCASLDKAMMDLDNDGRPDLVVKTSFCLKGAPSDSL